VRIQETTPDNVYRIAGFKVNGATLYTLSDDSEVRLDHADSTSGGAVIFDCDSTTHERSGQTLSPATSTGGVVIGSGVIQ
jgi:threonine dehydrogenase-like Zn-dependent dehydrogenase